MIATETGISKKTSCAVVAQETEKLIHSNELTRLMKPQNYCGILLVDGKWIKVKERTLVLISFVDYLTHDIPAYVIAYSENMYDIEEGFKFLKSIGYELKVIVADESMGEIVHVAKKVFPDVIIQLCLTHYTKAQDRTFVVNQAKRRIKSLERKLQNLGNSFFIRTHHHDIEKARKITNEIADLEHEFGYMISVQKFFQEIFWSVKTEQELSDAEDRMNEFIGRMNLDRYPHAEKIQKRYLNYYEKRELLTSFTKHPKLNIPRTTNLIEGFHSNLQLRLSTIRGFEKEGHTLNYLNALILKRRFKKFTDCKKKFKNLNGKSPLQISNPLNTFGFNFNDTNWINFCVNLKKETQK
jgi:hypothetical protein